MWCALLFYFVVTIFVVVYSLPELCVFKDTDKGKEAYCRIYDVKYRFDFIPPVSQIITLIDLQRQPIKQLPYNAFRNLSSQSSISEIWLEHCQISYVDAGALMNLHNLHLIDMSYNNINKIDSKLFRATKQIKEISLEYNKIEVLPNGLFQNLILLETVYLEHNRIHQVERFSFNNTPSLQLINFAYNQIEFMNNLFKDKFDNVKHLSFYNNPWKCNCELGPFYELLIKINRLHQIGFECKNPPILQGKKFIDVSRNEFVCHSEDAISTQDSVMTSTEPMTTTEQEDISVTVYCVDTGTLQLPTILHWIQNAVSGLMLVCIVPVIIGVVFVVRHTLASSNRRCHVGLPTTVIRRSDRGTNIRDMDSDLPMSVIQSSAVVENNDSV